MTLFRWAMRNGAPILFWISLLVFVVSLAGQFLTNAMSLPGQSGQSGRLWLFVTVLSTALSNSALIFAAACIVDLVGRRVSRNEDTR